MLWNLDLSWLMMAVAIVAMLAFMFGMALDGVMGGDAFGPLGNMVVITGGFFLGIFAVNYYGIPLRDLTRAVGYGMAGAFAVFALLAGFKASLNRL